MAERLQED